MELWTQMTSLNAYDKQRMMVQINAFGQHYESCTSVVGFENPTTEKRKLRTYIITIISIITAILYLCSFEILQSGPLAKIANGLDASTRIILFRVIQFAVFAPLMVLSIISMYRLQKSNDDSNISSMQSFNSGEYLLLTTAAINFVYSILIMIASIGALAENTKSDEYITDILQLIFSIIIVILVTIQTQFVMACHTWHRSGRKLPRIARHTVDLRCCNKHRGMAAYFIVFMNGLNLTTRRLTIPHRRLWLWLQALVALMQSCGRWS